MIVGFMRPEIVIILVILGYLIMMIPVAFLVKLISEDVDSWLYVVLWPVSPIILVIKFIGNAIDWAGWKGVELRHKIHPPKHFYDDVFK